MFCFVGIVANISFYAPHNPDSNNLGKIDLVALICTILWVSLKLDALESLNTLQSLVLITEISRDSSKNKPDKIQLTKVQMRMCQ